MCLASLGFLAFAPLMGCTGKAEPNTDELGDDSQDSESTSSEGSGQSTTSDSEHSTSEQSSDNTLSTGSSVDESSSEQTDSDGTDSIDSTSDSSTQSTDTQTQADCLDKQIGDEEVLPVRVDISDLVADYDESMRLPWAISVLQRRYPTGAFIMQEANNKTDCFEISVEDPSKAENVINGLRTAVHECGHMIDLNVPQRYVIRKDLQYKCDFSIASGGPARRIILDDEFQEKWPNDSFRKTYLEELGDQTFDLLLDEASQYINTLATSYAFYDYTTFDPVARDGVHAFYWYIARFLRKTRMEHADFYDKLVNDTCWRQVILATWGRSERYLVETQGLPGLGGEDDALLHELRNDPELVSEIDRLRELDGCSF